jgi:hypothetical protein
MRFRSRVLLGGKTATGIPVPDDVVAALGSHKRPAVLVTVGGHTYRTTVATMNGRFMLSLSAENRAAAGLSAGDEVEVDLELATAPEQVEVPADLAAALAADAASGGRARTAYDGLTPSQRKWLVADVEAAKKPETRARRVEKTVASLNAGKTAP